MAIDDKLLEAASKPAADSGWDDDGQEVSDPSRLAFEQQVPDLDAVRGDLPERPQAEVPPGEEKAEEPAEAAEGAEAAEAAEAAEGAEGEEGEESPGWVAPFRRGAGADAPKASGAGVEALRAEIVALREQMAAQAARPPEAAAAGPDYEAQRARLEERIEALEDDRDKADLDGETAKARAFDRQSRRLERELGRVDATEFAARQAAGATEVADRVRGEVRQGRAQDELDDVRLELMEDHPQFDRQSPEFDLGMEKEALRLYAGIYGAGGVAASDALRDAVGYVMAAAQPANGASGAEAAAKDAERVEEAVRRNVAAAPRTRTPARKGVSSARLGRAEEAPAPSKMTDEELAAMPATAKSRLRGDFV